MERIIFILVTIISFTSFALICRKIFSYFRFTHPSFPIKNIPGRILLALKVAIAQTKILRMPVAGFLHALVFWGFIVLSVGSLEMMIDGMIGTDRVFSCLGICYKVLTASGDIFALLITVSCIIYLARRYITKPKRFTAPEMKPTSRLDATFILSMILILMVSLLGMNAGFLGRTSEIGSVGYFPISQFLANYLPAWNPEQILLFEKINWWIHISLIFIFLNVLPLSKHFHVILSIPNVFLSRMEPKTKLNSLPSVTNEVKQMLDPSFQPIVISDTPKRFGVKDVEDVTWKNYLDALTCTECGRCTSVCPANITGKKLSPRKIFIDLRARMKEKGPGLLKSGVEYSDQRALLGDFISAEELWACTTCNACVEECPVNIDHPSLIVDMRRYLVMEESKAPALLNTMFTNLENNGAPWQFPADDRMLWAEGLDIPTMADLSAKGESPDILFWVGCSGSFDERYKSVTRAFATILKFAGIKFAVLGTEESCTGDPAKRAGNEFIAQLLALGNIQTLNRYNIKKIVTACPHCFNTLLNEYPDLGGNYEVIHHTTLLKQLIDNGNIHFHDSPSSNPKKITYHDSCYLGRGNGIYSAPRAVIEKLNTEVIEMKSSKSHGLCCGAGGAQMFKEEEKGKKGVNIERTEQALETGADVIATACPFCMTMMNDGLKEKNKEENIQVLDVAELVAKRL
ncbi:MAG: hypothetical protein A3H98_10915 [Bacteroidetes bacterium RIFCSPLOWO2_02_FULL_36_8]|nr:MAG: hypothetical protein A3H98_10915 [Bacteroidetes bacterium RIFCSPLOWO2_02_FULL_36_8]